MKKKLVILAIGVLMAFGALGLFGCGTSAPAGEEGQGGQNAPASPSGDISVYSREDGSGTRGAFIELFGIEEKQGDEKVDMTTPSAAITNSTSVMMTSVAGDPNGIGYLSLGSLDSSVKAVKIDGAEPTAENVASGTYKIARPFNIATKEGLSDAARDFVAFIMSPDGQKIVEDSGYIAVEEGVAAYTPNASASGKVVVAGSSSVTPVMEKLSEAYQKKNANVQIEVQQSDSTTGMNMAKDGTCDIGMASRELKDSETSAGLKATVIAQDGIAIIVNKESSVDDLTGDQVKRIFTGEATTWEDIVLSA